MDTLNKIITIYCESDGLLGDVFSVAVLLTDEAGEEVEAKNFVVNRAKLNDFYAKKIYKSLPRATTTVQANSTEHLMQLFAEFYKTIKDDYTVLYHTGEVVETGFFRKLAEKKYISTSELPVLPIELSSILTFLGENGDSVDAFNKKYDIQVTGDINDTIRDCRKTFACYKFIEHNLISLKFSEDIIK